MAIADQDIKVKHNRGVDEIAVEERAAELYLDIEPPHRFEYVAKVFS